MSGVAGNLLPMRQINLRLDDAMLEAIERARGATKREPYLRDILRTHLGLEDPTVGVQRRAAHVAHVADSARAKRDVMPLPKPGRR